jgi:hypothetical protein
MTRTATAQRALDAYGGAEFWARARHIDAVVSVEGLAFRLKGRPFFRHAAIRMDVAQPQSRLMPIGRDSAVAGVLDGDSVSLQSADDTVITVRRNARSCFPSLRRTFRWDDLDMAYFANYAFWNYFTLPALLLREDIRWIEAAPGILDAEFPSSLPTHSARQRFTFDADTGLLTQHDYAVDIIHRRAKVANVAVEHAEHAGIRFPARRIATPLNSRGAPMRRPVLIDIHVHEFSVTA